MVTKSYPDTWKFYTFRAMGSQITLWLDAEDSARVHNALYKVEMVFSDNEQALSRFRPTSELTRLNECSGEWVVVSDLMWREIKLAVEMAEATNGRFDPTLLNALELAGYRQSFELGTAVNGNQFGTDFEPRLGQWRAIEFDEINQAVKLPFGVRLDLGGIAKGDTAQQALALLEVVGPAMVDAGGDLVAGTAPVGFPGWPIAISSPWISSQSVPDDLFTLWLTGGTAATSGVDYRTWQKDGHPMHHLIDPLTGKPATSDGLTVTVIAREAAVAEGWATATLISGSTDGMNTLLDKGLAGLMITQDGNVLVTPAMDSHLLFLNSGPFRIGLWSKL